MKYPCNIIQDLLPLYHDNVCSEESRRAVQQHLPECEACQRRAKGGFFPEFSPKAREKTAAVCSRLRSCCFAGCTSGNGDSANIH